MSHMSQREASRLWGVSRGGIQRAIKSGKLSASEGGRIDASEMTRAFGPAQRRPKEPKEPPESERLRTENQVLRGQLEVILKDENNALRTELDSLRAALSAKDEHINDLRQAMRLLGHQGQRRRWWQFWR